MKSENRANLGGLTRTAALLMCCLASFNPCLAVENPEDRVDAFLQRYSSNGEEALPVAARSAAWKQLRGNILAGRVSTLSSSESTAHWTDVGPGWLFGEGGQSFTGRVSSIAVHPTNDNVVFIGTANGGVWLTIDGGSTWSAQTDDQKTLAIGSLAIATEANGNTVVYAGTGEGKIGCDSYYGQGLLRGEYDSNWDLVEGWDLKGDSADLFAHKAIKKILVHSDHSDWILVGTAIGNTGHSGVVDRTCQIGGDTEEVYGVWGSSDGGDTWTTVPLFDAAPPTPSTTIGTDFITDLEVEDESVANGMHVLVGVADNRGSGPYYGGIYRMTVVWPPWPSEDPPSKTSQEYLFPVSEYVTRAEVAVGSNSKIFAAFASSIGPTGVSTGWGGLFVWDGYSWDALDTPDGTNLCQSEFESDYAPSCPNPLDPCCDVYPYDKGCTVKNVCERTTDPIFNCWYDLALEVDTSLGGPDYIWLGGIGLWRGSFAAAEEDSTLVWSDMCSPVLHVDQHAIAFTPNTGRVWVANDGGIANANRTGTPAWVGANTDELNLVQYYPGASVYATSSRVQGLAGTQDNGVLRLDTDEPLTPWKQVFPWADGCPTAMVPDHEDTHWFAGVCKSAVYGTEYWTNPDDWVLTVNKSSNYWLYPFDLCEDDSNYLNAILGMGAHIYRFAYPSPPPLSLPWGQYPPYHYFAIPGSGGGITATEVIPTSPEQCKAMWVGFANGELYRTLNWSTWNTEPFYPNGDSEDVRAITSITVNPVNPDEVYVSFGGFEKPHIYFSENAMSANPDWESRDGSAQSDGEEGGFKFDYLPDVPVHKVLFDSSRDVVFAGTDMGVFSSEDQGNTWSWLDDGHPNSPVYDLVETNGEVFSFTHGRGAWRIEEFCSSEFVVDSEDDDEDDVLNGCCETASGECTLRAALQESNYLGEKNTIRFAVGSIPQPTALPAIEDPVIIDGVTGNPFGSVEIHKSGNYGEHGLRLLAGDSEVSGLVLSGYAKSGLSIETNGNNTITNCEFKNNGWNGLALKNSPGNTVGLIDDPNSGNIMTGNNNGIRIYNSDNTVVANNLIGGFETGNVGHGFKIQGSSGGNIVFNFIENNGGDGVSMTDPPDSSLNNSITTNRIMNNGGLGIDLANDGRTSNDPNDADTGPNELLNYPDITNAYNCEIYGVGVCGGGTYVTDPAFDEDYPEFRIQVFLSDSCTSGEGACPIYETDINLNELGEASWFFAAGPPLVECDLPPVTCVVATATRLSEGGDELSTSEFSVPFPVE